MPSVPLRVALAAAVILASAVAPQAQDGAERPAWQGHGIKPQSPDSPFDQVVSGLYFRSKETQAMQADDFNNPGFLAVEQGEELWSKLDGAAGKSCASCHNERRPP